MFFLGAYLGAKGTSNPPFWTRRAAFVAVALGALEAAFLFKILVPSYYSMMIDKSSLGILRVVYFALLVLLVATFVPRQSPFWQSWIARPVVLCGQQSLIVYCSGALLSTLASLVLSLGGGGWIVHGVVLAIGWIACFGTAYGWKVLRGSTWNALPERGLLSTSTVVLPGSREVPESARLEAGRPL